MNQDVFLTARTIPEAILSYAESDKAAVICGSVLRTYRELIRDARRLAGALAAKGVLPGDRVVLAMKRSTDFITALLGILTAGAAYVAMDLSWPEKRREHIIRDSGAKLVLDEELFAELMETAPSEEMPLPVLKGSDAFAVYYTSGSTGEPKGTVTHHQVFFNEAVPVKENICSSLTMEQCETFVSFGNFAYGATACDIAACLLYGKTLVFATEQERANPALLGELMQRWHVDAMLGTPSMLLMYLEDPAFADAFRSLRRVIITGEALSARDAAKFLKLTDAAVFDAFGASEVRNYAFARIRPGEEIRIQAPVHGAALLLLDEDGKPVPDGTKGELCIGGTPGRYGYYLGNEALTARKFIETVDFGRVYRTGDMARREEDGSLTMIGREDDLIKFHGQRMELEEVERCLQDHPAIKRAAAAVRGTGKDAMLFAWYTADSELDPYALRAYMEERLPAYMIPSRLQRLESLPLNANGKLDRKALPDIGEMKGEYVPPRSEEEKNLCTAFRRILGTEAEIGVKDHFFILGGDSFKAMRLIGHLRDAWGYTVTFPELFKFSTPEKLAGILRKTGEEEQASMPAVREFPESKIPKMLRERRSPEVEAILPVSQSMALYLIMKRYGITVQRNVNRLSARIGATWSREEFTHRVEVLIGNHPALRSEFVEAEKGGYWQILYRHKKVPVYYKDLRGLSEGAVRRFTGGFWQVMEEEAALFEAACFVLDDSSLLLIRADHTVADGVSLNVILNELAAENVESLKPDEYILHRKRALTEADVVPQWLREYYRGGHFPLAGGKPGKTAETALTFSPEETGRLSAFCARRGFTLHTLMQLVYGKTLLELFGGDELWLIHVDHGRHSEWGDELRIVGNLMTGFPVRIDRNMTGTDLQEDILRIRQFPAITDCPIFMEMNIRKCPDGIISQNFAPLNPVILESRMLDAADVQGNAMKIMDGALVITFRNSHLAGLDDQISQFREIFNQKLREEQER